MERVCGRIETLEVIRGSHRHADFSQNILPTLYVTITASCRAGSVLWHETRAFSSCVQTVSCIVYVVKLQAAFLLLDFGFFVSFPLFKLKLSDLHASCAPPSLGRLALFVTSPW